MAAPGGDVDEREESIRYLLIVSRERPDLLHTARRRFIDDEKVYVIVDRRHGERRQQRAFREPERRCAERRAPTNFWEDLRFHPVVIAPKHREELRAGGAEVAPWPGAGSSPVAGIEGEVGRRLARWRDESTVVLGQLLPALLDRYDNQHARTRAAEEEADRLRRERDTLGAELDRLQAENDALKAERAAVREEMRVVVERLEQLLQPVSQTVQRARLLRS